MKKVITLAALAVLMSTAAHAANNPPPPAIQKMFDACKQRAAELEHATENGELAANFNAACGLGLVDGYSHNVKERARIVKELDDAQQSNDGYSRMAIETMHVRYLRSYDAAEAEANKNGK